MPLKEYTCNIFNPTRIDRSDLLWLSIAQTDVAPHDICIRGAIAGSAMWNQVSPIKNNNNNNNNKNNNNNGGFYI